LALNASFGFSGKDVRPAGCTASEEVGDFVYVSGVPVLGRDQVRRANPDSPLAMPAVGVVIFKVSSEECLVQWIGETPDVFAGLTAGKQYWLGPNAKAASLPTRSATGRLAQVVGVATAPTRFYVKPDGVMTKLFT